MGDLENKTLHTGLSILVMSVEHGLPWIETHQNDTFTLSFEWNSIRLVGPGVVTKIVCKNSARGW